MTERLNEQPTKGEHPHEQAFVDFVMGTIEPAESHALEAHVSRCEACAARLAREAKVELALAEVARTEEASTPRAASSSGAGAADTRHVKRPWRLSRALPLAAAAAAVWAAFAHRTPSAEASGPIPNVVCPDGAAQDECIERAHRHGLFVAYPPRADAPRFEARPGAPGWSLVGPDAPSYALTRDLRERHGGAASAVLSSKTAAPEGAGVVEQAFDARPWRGRKARFSAFIKTDDVRGWAGLWMRVDRTRGRAPFDNMQARPLRGSSAWTEHAVVLEVPDDATSIRLGLLQDGAGRTWIDGARFEAVADDVPVTTADDRPLSLSDGGFERGDLDKAGWFMSGNASEQFASSIDRAAHHGGTASARLASIVATPSGYGVLMHAMRAEHVRGQRLRLRAWIRGEGITGRGDFWARVQAVDSPADGPGLGYGACELTGTFAFRACEIVLDVGERADSLEIGLGLGGPGTVWLDDVTLEPVDAAATPLAIWKPTPLALENGDFEREGDAPQGWMVSGNAHAAYEAGVDRAERHGGAASGRLAPKPGAEPKGYGSLLQSVDAALYRGKRLRARAWVKGEGVSARGDVWMRVQAASSPADGGGLGGGRCALHGTFDWQPCAVVFDVPPEAAYVQIGAGVDGPGRLWLDDVAFEEVDPSVPVTNPSRAVTPQPAKPDVAGPVDLDFERLDQAL
jgi:hypothetical protein